MLLKTTCLRLVAILAILLTVSCSIYRNDRMWISDVKYDDARRLYDETGSLALTEQKLAESEKWRRAEIDEALYRLRKQHHLE
ncbi:hypothetical protein JW916_01435 [Candidatus Sumerlaeota bacterium]|nr:hypothetical protein [Candidatus Sumerlaeota bacterium]